MKLFTVIQGDDEELALSIEDPVTGGLVDLSVDYGWTLSITFKGKKNTLTKAYLNSAVVVNIDHLDSNIPDYSVKILLTAAETAALAPGVYLISAFVTDAAGLKTTIIKGELSLIIQKTP